MSCFHYTGHLRHGSEDPRWSFDTQQLNGLVDQVLERNHASIAFGSLSCGADLLIVERAIRRGVKVHGMLPCTVDEFIDRSVRCGGESAIAQFRRVCGQLASLTELVDQSIPDDRITYRQISHWAMENTRQTSRKEGCLGWQLALWDGDTVDEYGTGADVAAWHATGGPSWIISLPSLEVYPSLFFSDPLRNLRIRSLCVEEELQKAWKAAHCGLPEASVIHATRLLESVVVDSCARIRMRLGRLDTFFVLNELAAARRMDPTTVDGCHLLRHTGNAVRHVQRKLGAEEHWVCLATASRLLRWYLKEILNLGVSEKDPLGVPKTSWDESVRQVVEARSIEQVIAMTPALLKQGREVTGLVLLGLEKAIDLEAWPVAEELLMSLRRDPTIGRRLLELEALMLSRRGEPHLAIELLSQVPQRNYDIETPGILAGAYKRQWLRDQQLTHLGRAGELYTKAWRNTGNTYVGVNAAACASWLGNAQKAKKIATKVAAHLKRHARFWPTANQEQLGWDFYSLATMAEALWLTGQRDESKEWQQRAILSARHTGAPVEIFLDQMQLHQFKKN